MLILVIGVPFLFILYSLLHDSSTPSPQVSRSKGYNRSTFDYDQLSVQYNGIELVYNETAHSLHLFGRLPTNQYDYREIRYPIPFSQYYQYEEERYKNYNTKHSILVNAETGPILPSSDPSAIMLIIGSDSKQFYSMVKSIEQAFNTYYFSALTILDYGLTTTDLRHLQKSIECLHLNSIPIYYRVFNFDSCPTWISISQCATRGGYSWKAISYVDATLQWNGKTLWLDAGVMIQNTFVKDLEYVNIEGFYSPKSYDPVEKWMNPSSTLFLKGYYSIPDSALNKTNCLSAYVLVNPRNETIRYRVLYPYYQCAFTKSCLYPTGSSRANHRGEQSILSALVNSIHIPHTASNISGRRPPFRQNRRIAYSDICSSVCLQC